MRILIFILFLVSFAYAQTPTIEPGVSQGLARWRAARYSDVRYKLNLTLEKMSPVLKGTMEIRVRVGNPELFEPGRVASRFPQIILDWRKIKGVEDRSTISNTSINGREVRVTPLGVMPAAEVTPEGVTLTAEESNEHIIFRDGVVTGENVIKLDFTSPILTSGSAITRYVDKEDGSEYIYSLFVPSDASTAFPVFDQPDLKARFELDLKVDKEWKVVSNSHIESATKYECKDRQFCANGFAFTQTKPISTYVFAFAAGPWQQVSEPGAVATGSPRESEATKGNPVATAPGSDFGRHIFVRKSQLEKFKPHAAEVFRLNREGIKFLEQYFDYKFPFPKYDIVLIPEFPFGGMEHAGATFLREDRVIFPQEPTKNDYITRANVIFHEAAHQWFGDTVTMKWFDDLWLKEGFAEFMAYKTLEKVMPEYNAWKVFYERNKQAAYMTDSTKGTTPIYQEIANLSAAKSAYGNIVYRKAPSFLKQAEFYIGPDKFQTAVRAFLRKHEFGNAGWEDLVTEFETASGQDLKEWARNWVRERGMYVFHSERHDDWHDYYDPKKKAPPLVAITPIGIPEDQGMWNVKTKLLFRYSDQSNDVVERELWRSKTIGGRTILFRKGSRPELIFPNYQDYGYGIFLLDDKSRDYVLKNIQNEKDDFLRSMMWGSLWDSVREAELDPKEYVELAIKNVGLEKDESTIQTILARVSTAMTYYRSEPRAVATGSPHAVEATRGNPVATAPGSDLSVRLESMLIEKLQHASTLGQRITFYRAFLNMASTEKARSVLKDILNLKFQISDLKLKTKDRFDIVTRLLILNDPDAPRMLADLEKTETSDEAKRYAYAAKAGIATAQNKAKFWNDFTANKEISESWIEAAFGPFNSVRHAGLTLPYLERALKELPNHKRNRKIFFVNGWLGAFIGGQRSEEALAIVNKFLADNPNLDRDLRLKILENVDVIERAVKIRAKHR